MDWLTFLKLWHILGTVLGVGATTFSEVFYLKFLARGEHKPLEEEILKFFYRIIRLGTVILVFSGFGYLVLWRLKVLGPEVFFSDRFLAKMTVVMVLLFTAFGLNFKLISPKIGGAIAFSSWYVVMILGIWRKIPFSLPIIILGYVIVTCFVYYVLEYLRDRARKINK